MSDDKEIREIFTRARRADRSEAPSFDQIRRAGRAAERTAGRRLFATAALGTLAAGIVLVLAAVPLLRAPTPLRAPELEPAVPPPPAAPFAQQLPLALSGPSKDDQPKALPAEIRREQRPAPETAPGATAATPGEDAVPSPEELDRLRALGYVGESTVQAQEQALRPEPERIPVQAAPFQVVTQGTGTKVSAPGQGAPDTGLQYRMDGGRKTELARGKEVAAAAPPAERFNPDVIEEMDVLSSGAHPEPGRAPRRFDDVLARRPGPEFNTESYAPLPENPFFRVSDTPVSTFSVDVDTASYTVVRRHIESGSLPPRDAVRIEELINYFPSSDPAPRGRDPFAVYTEIADCPWAPRHRLARIALRGREVERRDMPGSNLVFLVDVSGSMDQPAKLPLVQWSLRQLASRLDRRDEVAIVVYAGSSGMVLPPTRGSARDEILEALDRLRAGGSTNGGEGLRLAYATARRRFIHGGINRVILATDGDFNVGITDKGELVRFVEQQAGEGIFLTVLGFGMGNYKDDMLELLADRGNGNYAYIDSPQEAHKALVEQMGGTLLAIAKDVKIQIEFNPAEVGAYRLIGYENRILRREDFNDDTKDAGEIGAGHSVTALYEIVPAGLEPRLPSVDPLKYQSEPRATGAARSGGEAFTVKLRYKEPDGHTSRLLEHAVIDDQDRMRDASDDLRFAAAVASFGMLLRESSARGSSSFPMVLELAGDGLGQDPNGHRREFLRLVRAAMQLSGR